MSGCVLVAVDFSPNSRKAVEQALRQARCLQLPLVVLHVVNDPAWSPGFYGTPPSSGALKTLDDRAREQMDELVRQTGAGVELRTRVVRGVVVSRILEVAEQERAELVVVGSKGHGGASRLLLGSVADKVVKLSPIPVLVVPERLG